MKKKRFEQIAGFNDRNIMLVGIPIAAVIVSLLLFNERFVAGEWSFLLFCYPISLIHTTCFWVSMRWAYMQARLRFPTMRDDLAKRLLIVLLSFFVVFAIVNSTLDFLFRKFLLPEHFEPINFIFRLLTSFLISALVITLYEALSFYTLLQRSEADRVDLQRRHVESQLAGLRNQVNPHFLFNSLNTLVYLIPESPEKAVRFVQQLSKVYRYVLEIRDTGLIPLREELEYLKSYIFLIKERFGENIDIRIRELENEELEHSQIVPLTLQMLFENAIKHNIISAQKPLHVEVWAENNWLAVRNNLQRKAQVMDSTGVGLENIRSRYRMLANEEVQVIVSLDYFTVLLPLRITQSEFAL
ncbi:MAG: sensor histidine kinase [Saprospiraceae bacterium]